MKTHFSKRILSLVLAFVLVVTAVPTFVLFGDKSIEAQAKEAPNTAASDYWQILASTDFTGTEWEKSSDYVWYTTTSPRTSAGGYSMGWNTQTNENESSANTVDSAGIHFDNSDYRGLLALSSFTVDGTQYNNSNYKSLFDGIDSFKIDLTFSYTGNSYGQGGTLNSRQNGTPLLKLSKDTSGKLKFNDRECWNEMYFTQEAYGRRHINGTQNIYATSSTQEGGAYNISTYNSTGAITSGTELHYIVYVADGWLCCYLTNAAGDLLINYDPIDVSSYSLSPSDITSIYLGGSRFSWTNHSDLANVAYKSIEIYKGVEPSDVALDTTKTKYLYTYFTGNSTNGESLHYAVSDDGIDFKPVNNGLPVWDSTASWSITQYPTGSTSGVATSKHVRDPYMLNKRNISTGAITSGYYILATDLNTQNGSNWGNNSKLLVYDVANLQNIDTTTPWVIDTTDMCSSLTGGSVSRAWAPQAIWDNVEGKYMLYWSVGYIGGQTKIFYTYTTDFKTFNDPVKQLVYPTFCDNFIDADITYHNGIYYMFFKDEDEGQKKIYRAIAPRPNGPYQGFTKFSDSGMEGPQVYQRTPDGSYAFMTDVYGSGGYNIYRASVPRNLNESEIATSNINYLSPRHGSVIRITPAEYTAIVNKFGTLTPNTVEYYWANETSWGNNEKQGTVMKDTAGHDYVSAWWSGGATVGGNKITLTNGAIYSTDNEMRQILSGDSYTIDFTFKSNGSTTKDDTHTIAAITNSDSSTYVCITTSGKFFVNGTEATYVNQSALTTALNASTAQRYRITFNGYATCLMVGDTYVGGAINTTAMDSSNIWLAFGLGSGSINGNSIDTRLSGEWGKVTISPTATDIGETAENALLDTIRPDRDDLLPETDQDTNITFNATAYHGGNAADNKDGTKGYSNVVYDSNSTAWGNEQDKFYCTFKVDLPSSIVLVYDGVESHKPSLPIVFEMKKNGSSSNNIKCVDSRTTNLDFLQNWIGWTDSNMNNGSGWLLWPGSVVATSTDSNYTTISCDSDHQYDVGYSNTTTRFFWNRLYYTGNMTNNTIYSETFTSESFYARGYSRGSGNEDKTWSHSSNIYVINYKPVYDILKSTTTATKSTNAGNKTALQLYDYLMDENGEAQWMYTTESRINALIALKELADCNPKNYTYSGNEATAVSNCAAAIEAAKTAWDGINLVKKTFTVNYNKYGNVNSSVSVTAGNTLSGIPANTSTSHINNSNYHWTYSWTSSTGVWDGTQTPSSSHVPHSNETYIETRGSNAVHCDYLDWNDEWNPTDNHESDGWTHHNGATSDDNGYSTSYCVECRGSETVYDPHPTEWATYDEYVGKVNASGEYTTDSISNYSTQVNTITAGVTDGDETKSASFITTKNTALETAADTYLNPLAEYSKLVEKQDTRAINNYVGDVQQYTYTSWMNFATAYDYGKAYYDAAPDKSNIGMYVVNGDDTVSSTKTVNQNTIETRSGATNTAFAALADSHVDTAEKYQSFDYAKTVADNIDKDKFTQAGITAFTTAKNNAYNAAYVTLDDSNVAAYNAATGNRGFSAGDKIKNSSNVDAQTTALLGAVTTLNSCVKQLWVSLTVQTEDNTVIATGDTVTVPYGTSKQITLPDGVDQNTYSVDRWSITNYSYTDNHEGETSISSSKVTGDKNTLTRVVTNNIAVTAIVSNKSFDASTLKKVVINNIYGNVQNVYYIASGTSLPSGSAIDNEHKSITIGSNTVTAADIPFYSFDGWTLKSDDTNKVYTYTPKYASAPSYNFNFIGATSSSATADYDKRVTLNYNSAIEATVKSKNDLTYAKFKAWAVKTSAGKYQIASYRENYFFFACAAENYVPIMNVGSDETPVYKAVVNADGTLSDTLTASMIDAEIPSYADINANAVLQNKLDNSLPFISIQTSKIAGTQARVYARVSNGSSNLNGFGVLIKSNCADGAQNTLTEANATMKRTVTNILETGQFTYTLTKTGGFNNPVGFRGFVNYGISYTAATTPPTTPVTINAIEYSNGSRALPSA